MIPSVGLVPDLPLDLQRRIFYQAGGLAPLSTKGTYDQAYRQQSACWLGISLKELGDYFDHSGMPGIGMGLMILSVKSTIIILSLEYNADGSMNRISKDAIENNSERHVRGTELYNPPSRAIDSLMDELGIRKEDIIFIMPDINTHGVILFGRKSCGVYAEYEPGLEIYQDLYSKRLIEESTYFLLSPFLMISFLYVSVFGVSGRSELTSYELQELKNEANRMFDSSLGETFLQLRIPQNRSTC